jgi:hypothetical protein
MIDSSMCAVWMQAGMIDSTACVKMENGKCHMKSDACMKAMKECHKGMEGCGNMSKEECQEKMSGEKDCCKKK